MKLLFGIRAALISGSLTMQAKKEGLELLIENTGVLEVGNVLFNEEEFIELFDSITMQRKASLNREFFCISAAIVKRVLESGWSESSS